MIPLNQIRVSQIHVPEPCGEDWEAMDGDARRRLCAGCGCHVHDLSAMTTAQAQDLIDRTEGRLCVRFQARPDGSPLTLDAGAGAAPVAARPAFRRGRLAAAASWAVALAVTGLGLTSRADAAPQAASHAAAGHKPHVRPKPHAPAKPQAVPAVPVRPHRFLGRIAPRHPVTPTTQKPAGVEQGQPALTTPSAPPPQTVVGVPAISPPTTLMGGGSFLMGGGSAGPTISKHP